MLSDVPVLLSGISAGVILFQTAIIAPSVFIGLGPDHAGPFLRKVFPKFFILLVNLSSRLLQLQALFCRPDMLLADYHGRSVFLYNLMRLNL
jgi:hypothetical protein